MRLKVAKQDFKFNAAHFMQIGEKREKLHGHNYHVEVEIEGPIGIDGYVIDFGVLKKAIRNVCQSLDEHFLVAANSQTIIYSEHDTQIELRCSDGAFYSFPHTDCVLLPTKNTSVEELSTYLSNTIMSEIGYDTLKERNISKFAVSLYETPDQGVTHTHELQQTTFE